MNEKQTLKRNGKQQYSMLTYYEVSMKNQKLFRLLW